MTSAALTGYLRTADPVAAPGLRALEEAILAVRPDLDVEVRYKIVMYAIDGDWRHWLCSIEARRTGLCLRFLHGVLLDDPLGVLRLGTATLSTWDMPFDGVPDRATLTPYLAQAVELQPVFRADPKAAQELARERRAVKGHRSTRGVRT